MNRTTLTKTEDNAYIQNTTTRVYRKRKWKHLRISTLKCPRHLPHWLHTHLMMTHLNNNESRSTTYVFTQGGRSTQFLELPNALYTW